MSHSKPCGVPNSTTPIENLPSSSNAHPYWEDSFSDFAFEQLPLDGLDEPLPLVSPPPPSDLLTDLLYWDFNDKFVNEQGLINGGVDNPGTSNARNDIDTLPYLNPAPLDHPNGGEDNRGPSNAGGDINAPLYLNPAPLNQSNSSSGSQIVRGVTHPIGGEDNSGPSNAGHAPPYLNPAPLNQLNRCSGCQILRVVTHTNGNYRKKLEIHGTVGIVYHAIYKMQYEAVEGQFIDLSMQSMGYIKQYLIDYYYTCTTEGFVLSEDPLFPFYDALCVNMAAANNVNFNPDDCIISSEPEPELGSRQLRTRNVGRTPVKLTRSTIAAQRERTGKMELRELVDYFHLPMVDAAKEMGICVTAVKKICRKHGIERWPHRKIKSIDRNISKLQLNLQSDNGEEVANARAKIKKLRRERAHICRGIDPQVDA